MGRHSDGLGEPARAAPAEPVLTTGDVVVWGPFATVAAAVAAWLDGAGLAGTALVAGLGSGATGLLWAVARRAGPHPRPTPGRRRVQ
jgi:hypothetical protein